MKKKLVAPGGASVLHKTDRWKERCAAYGTRAALANGFSKKSIRGGRRSEIIVPVRDADAGLVLPLIVVVPGHGAGDRRGSGHEEPRDVDEDTLDALAAGVKEINQEEEDASDPD